MIVEEYHYFKIAASQVDIIAHCMGGLMARGFHLIIRKMKTT